MNFKSRLKYFSYSRSVGPGESSESKQRQPESEDAARARGGRATAALERGQLRTRVPGSCDPGVLRGPSARGPILPVQAAGLDGVHRGAVLAWPLWRGIL